MVEFIFIASTCNMPLSPYDERNKNKQNKSNEKNIDYYHGRTPPVLVAAGLAVAGICTVKYCRKIGGHYSNTDKRYPPSYNSSNYV
jgi:hypothetical protein